MSGRQDLARLEVTPERRCTPHDPDDYFYSQAVEQHVVANMGGIIYGPYTGTQFASTSETDIEHIIARSETHDSGLCRAGTARRRRYMDDRDGDGVACEREAAVPLLVSWTLR